MKIKRQREFWCGVLFVALGLAFAWAAGTWPLGHRAAPGPGFFGVVLALALTLLGGLVLFMATAFEAPDGDLLGSAGLGATTWVMLSLLAFGLLAPRLGLVGAVAAATLLARPAWNAGGAEPSARPVPLSRAMRWRATRRALAAALVQAAAAALAAWVVFHLLLGVRVPMGPH